MFLPVVPTFTLSSKPFIQIISEETAETMSSSELSTFIIGKDAEKVYGEDFL